MIPNRRFSFADRLIAHFDQGLRTLVNVHPGARPNPADGHTSGELTAAQTRRSIGLMRVNHSGEVAAQALYHGQALTARSEKIREAMQIAGEEENDHLVWCRTRLDELGSRPSVLTPVWYVGSFILGAGAGLAGDKLSLGFLAETEYQVVAHLNEHLQQMPVEDHRSREILGRMSEEEAEHATVAVANGAVPLPSLVRHAMRWVSQDHDKDLVLGLSPRRAFAEAAFI